MNELHVNHSVYVYKDGSIYLHFSEHPEKGSYHQMHFLCSQLSLQSRLAVQCANLSACVWLRDLLSCSHAELDLPTLFDVTESHTHVSTYCIIADFPVNYK